jgi:hypothetical protein
MPMKCLDGISLLGKRRGAQRDDYQVGRLPPWPGPFRFQAAALTRCGMRHAAFMAGAAAAAQPPCGSSRPHMRMSTAIPAARQPTARCVCPAPTPLATRLAVVVCTQHDAPRRLPSTNSVLPDPCTSVPSRGSSDRSRPERTGASPLQTEPCASVLGVEANCSCGPLGSGRPS